MLSLALCLLATAQQETQIETILNGDFERFVEQIGGTNVDIFGAFWIGAEGVDAGNSSYPQNVVDVSGNHVLRLSSTTQNVISQRVPLPIPKDDPGIGSCPGGPDGEESDVEIGFKVRGESGSSAYVSLLEDSGYHTAFHWKALYGVYHYWNSALGDYVGALASDPRLTAWQPLQEQRIASMACGNLTPSANGMNLDSPGTTNTFNGVFARVEGGFALQAVWVAPYTGIVRVFDRPAPFVGTEAISPGAPKSFKHEIYHDSGSSCMPAGSPISSVVFSDSSTNPDKDGILVTRRIEVEAGDRIVFRLSNDVDPGTEAITIRWHPALRYETYCDPDGDCEDPADIRGRRVTYYAASSAPTAMLGETLVALSGGAPTSSFATYSGLAPLQLSGDPLGSARGALDLVLGSYDTSKNVEFDDVSCLVEFDDVADEDELIEQCLADITQSRDNHRYIRDRDETHDSACLSISGFSGQAGSIATPWVCHPLDVVAGPETQLVTGSRPASAAVRQSVSFDGLDFTDLDFLDEANAQRADSGTFVDTRDSYRCGHDDWVGGPTYVSIKPEEHLERYLQLGDVEELRRALEQCHVMSQNGVVTATGDPRVGVILTEGYVPSTGVNPFVGSTSDVDAHWDPWLVMEPPSAMVRTVVECLRAKAVNSNLSTFLDGSKMEDVWEAAKVAASKGAELKHFHEPTHTYGEWEGTWLSMGGYFNDTWGYGARVCWPAVDAIDSYSGSVPYTTSKSAMKSVFYNDFILSGGYLYFLDLWEQSTCRYASTGADEMRAWESFGKLYDYIYAQNPSHTALDDLTLIAHEAALNALKFQYAADGPGGVWFNSNHDDFQMTELVGPFGGFSYGPELALSGGAIALHSLSGSEREDMLDLMSTVSRVTNLNFGREYGHEMGVVPLFDLGITQPVEGRGLGAKVWIIEAIDAAPTAPTMSFSIDDLDTTPSSLVFTVNAPTGTINDVVDERSMIGYWSVVGSEWVWTSLWADGTGSLSTPAISGDTATWTLASTGFPSGDVKFRVVAWTADGDWRAKTSYQQW